MGDPLCSWGTEAREVRSSSRRQGSAQACLPAPARLCARPPTAFPGRGDPGRWAAAGCSSRAWEKPGLGHRQQRATRPAGEGRAVHREAVSGCPALRSCGFNRAAHSGPGVTFPEPLPWPRARSRGAAGPEGTCGALQMAEPPLPLLVAAARGIFRSLPLPVGLGLAPSLGQLSSCWSWGPGSAPHSSLRSTHT